MSKAPVGIQMAGVAQKMVNILAFNCPPTYRCGGPAFAAQVSLDSILHIMGVGVALLQRGKHGHDTTDYEKFIKENAVCGPSMMKGFVKHKSQILGGALHAITTNIRSNEFRECPEVTEEAMLMLVQWYLQKSGIPIQDFVKKLEAGDHDQLTELDKTDTTL